MKTYCHHCGTALLPAAAFCHTCGTEVPDAVRQQTHVAPHVRAVALARMGHLDEAIAAYEDIIAHAPDDAGAFVALATLRIAARDAAGAETLLRDALALDEAHAVAWAYLGALLLERAAVSDAEDAFALALRHAPENCIVRLKRGEAFLRLGRTYDAVQELTHAVMLPPPDTETGTYARTLLKAARAQAARSVSRTPVGGTASASPRRLVRWMGAGGRGREASA